MVSVKKIVMVTLVAVTMHGGTNRQVQASLQLQGSPLQFSLHLPYYHPPILRSLPFNCNYKKDVSVMVNPGGTNEKFALANLPDCTLIVHQQNAEIPGLIAEEKADIMITETMEARRYVRDNAKLAAPLIEEPFTKNNFGILMQQGDQIFLNYVNMWMEEMELNGTFARLDAKYIK